MWVCFVESCVSSSFLKMVSIKDFNYGIICISTHIVSQSVARPSTNSVVRVIDVFFTSGRGDNNSYCFTESSSSELRTMFFHLTALRFNEKYNRCEDMVWNSPMQE